ncbi:MAG: hypothetical protein AAF711_04055 [Planctomycetota bacterium]
MSEQPPNTIADRFEAYLLGQLDDAATVQLEQELRQAPQQAEECLAVMKTLAMVREQFRDQREQAGELTKDPTLHGFHDLLSDLSAMEAAAEAEPVQLVGQIGIRKPLWQQWQFMVPSGIAALLAIAVVLIVAIPSGNTATNNPSFTSEPGVPSEPGPIGPGLSEVVATLTGERGAVWSQGSAEGALTPGSQLRAGDRFTLNQGFAEITTQRGAVMILEGPATIELIDSPNALRLWSGKLVGICDSASSKGLMVYTRQLQVHDLGTRFGVDASASDTTIVQVFQGEVEVSRAADSASSDDGSDPLRLLANDAISASDGREQWTRVDPAPGRFAVLRPTVQTLRGSGKGIRLREVDPQWQVVAIDGESVDRPIEMVVSSFESHTKNFPNDPGQSQWVAYLPSKEVADRKISYVVRTTLELPGGIDPASASIRMRYVPDNDLRSLRVNGAEIKVPEVTSPASEDRVDEFTERYELWISSGLVEGQNTIEFELVDYAMVVGINVQWELYATTQLPRWSDRP